VYCANNPLKFIDPTGLYELCYTLFPYNDTNWTGGAGGGSAAATGVTAFPAATSEALLAKALASTNMAGISSSSGDLIGGLLSWLANMINGDNGPKNPEVTKDAGNSTSGDPSGGSGNNDNPNQNPKLISNPKHNQNSNSPEPKNTQALFDKSIVDSNGVRWAKDSNGVIHRFSKASNGECHWNGSTAGKNPIQMRNIPSDIRKALK
jgi:hypothetical protein